MESLIGGALGLLNSGIGLIAADKQREFAQDAYSESQRLFLEESFSRRTNPLEQTAPLIITLLILAAVTVILLRK
ncbi:MAG: hypothetical protein AAFR66_17890 [Bacteroidota bacterium]